MLKIKKVGHKALNKKCIEMSNPWLSADQSFARHLLVLLKQNKALGIAANQVGDFRQVIVVKLKQKYHIMHNPYWSAVINSEGEYTTQASNEGCLSILNRTIKVPRYDHIKVQYLSSKFKEVQYLTLSGLDSAIIQHECDHLNGITLIERELLGLEGLK